MTLSRKIGIFFWSLAVICYSLTAYGFLAHRGDFQSAGLAGGAWFTLCACLPRELFIARGMP